MRLLLDAFHECEANLEICGTRIDKERKECAINMEEQKLLFLVDIDELAAENARLQDMIESSGDTWWGIKRNQVGYFMAVVGTAATATGVAVVGDNPTVGAMLIASGIVLDVGGLLLVW